MKTTEQMEDQLGDTSGHLEVNGTSTQDTSWDIQAGSAHHGRPAHICMEGLGRAEGRDRMGNKKNEGKEPGKLDIRHRDRQDVLAELRADRDVWEKFMELPEGYREGMMLYAMGEQGLHITYDVMFHEVMDPVLYPERMEGLLSAVLGEEVQIMEVLDREGIRLSENSSFVVADFIVRNRKDEYLNLEIQKVGYAFPLQRSDCYAADIVMRQYDRLKRESGRKFYFGQLSKVVTVVIMESSYGPFLADHAHAVHHRYSVFDTGLAADGLWENYYICLDIYKKYLHTGIRNKREAWMSFLSSVTLQDILELCGACPEFIPIYEHVFSFREDVRAMVDKYAEALQIMDHNTELYMVEEMRMELEAKDRELETKDRELDANKKMVEAKDRELDANKKMVEAKDRELDANRKELDAQAKEIARLRKQLEGRG